MSWFDSYDECAVGCAGFDYGLVNLVVAFLVLGEVGVGCNSASESAVAEACGDGVIATPEDDPCLCAVFETDRSSDADGEVCAPGCLDPVPPFVFGFAAWEVRFVAADHDGGASGLLDRTRAHGCCLASLSEDCRSECRHH